MTKSVWLSLPALIASPTAALSQDAPSAPVGQAIRSALVAAANPKCDKATESEVVVCGRSHQRYRIDPQVLAATRMAEAPPPKPQLDASRNTSCVGPNCGGGTIPLIGVALTALKAAELATQGDDWRDAFRTHPDQYQLYEERKRESPSIDIGITAGNKAPPR